MKEHWHDYQERDYNKEYDLLSEMRPKVYKVTEDHNWQLLKEEQQQKNRQTWTSTRTTPKPVALTLRERVYLDPKQSTRNRLRFGRLETVTQSFGMWGFFTWQEFNDHLHIGNKQTARDVYEQLKLSIADTYTSAGLYELQFWLPKTDGAETVKDFMAFSLLDCKSNNLTVRCLYQNQLEERTHTVKQSTTNTIRLKF